ncbi:hypothetical protein GCM10009106_07710 [Sphingomonas japonica]
MLLAAALLCAPLAACGGTPDTASDAETAGPVQRAPVSRPSPTEAAIAPADDAIDAKPAGNAAASHMETANPISCASERGQPAADRLARLCRSVSPATRPPCNAANSCALIEDEIARGCALFDDAADPMPGCDVDPKGEAAAVAVVRRFYSALAAHDYGTAWQQWGNDGPPGQTLDAFRRGYADTRSTKVTIGKVEPGSGGAGSIYQPVPVTVDSVLADGTRQRFFGEYVVRRVNGVDGASADQLRWHIDSATLRAR